MHTLFQTHTHCEQWILQVVLLEHEQILQLGYSLPLNPSQQGLLWARLFDEKQHRFHSESFDYTDFRSSEKFFFVQLGKSWLRQQAALGELRPAAQHWFWDIDLEETQAMPDYPPLFRQLPASARKNLVICADRVNLRASGELRLPESLRFENEPACLIRQGIEASKWPGFLGHCNSFLEEDDAVLELYYTKQSWHKYKLQVYVHTQGHHFWLSGTVPRLSLDKENQILLQNAKTQLQLKMWPLQRQQEISAAGLYSGLSSLEIQLISPETESFLSAGNSFTLFTGAQR